MTERTKARHSNGAAAQAQSNVFLAYVVYASGVSSEQSDLFCPAEARKITANGLITVEDLPEAAAIAEYSSPAEHP
jgi:hypothetical protein